MTPTRVVFASAFRRRGAIAAEVHSMSRHLAVQVAGMLLAATLAATMPTVLCAETIIGPGPVATPLNLSTGDYRVLAGTEIVSHTAYSANNELGGDTAIEAYGAHVVFEGGHVEGATVTTQAATTSAHGGFGILFPGGTPHFDFYDGAYRGGSVVIGASPLANAIFAGGNAIATGSQTILDLRIFGGSFEGGTVSMASSPNTIVSRAFALNLGNFYAGTVDVYGGQFVGGILLGGATEMRFHGSQFNVQPPPVNGHIDAGTVVTVSGIYGNGTPFSHLVRTGGYTSNGGGLTVRQNADVLIIQIPEPTTLALAALGFLSLPSRRSKMRRQSLRRVDALPRASARLISKSGIVAAS